MENWGIFSKVSPKGNCSPDSCLYQITPRTITPRTFSTRTIILEKFPPGQLPLGQLHPMKFPHDSYPGQLLLNSFPLDIYPRTITPPHMKLPCGICLLNFCFPDIFPWIIPSKQLPSFNCHRNSSRGKSPRTFPLKNKPWITYRWSSKKALFTFFSVEISNKFRKRLSKGLCMLLRGNILRRWNPWELDLS